MTYNCLIPVDALHFYDGTGICHVLLVIHLALRSIAYNYYTVCMKATSLEKVVQTESKSFSNFQYSNIKSNSGMQWFCFTTVCDWSTKLAILSTNLSGKTKSIANCSLLLSHTKFCLHELYLIWLPSGHKSYFLSNLVLQHSNGVLTSKLFIINSI